MKTLLKESSFVLAAALSVATGCSTISRTEKQLARVDYDERVGDGPLKKAVAKYNAEVVYDYSIISALTIRIPDGKTLEDATKYFKKIKGVVEVSKNSNYVID